ncbi:hypothetical protein M7I_5072 [Glarea lozoyensis 74030]|uniref:Uncharacterized protein n=1 Tax=Glarea lozoyensis (strain ATCC 74030 / MF5533) TaxID=1104152 RepID=H0EQW3_GLAL7|nr:hypothetical protein M7I_5072 [Glarea lozoyensis 74030]
MSQNLHLNRQHFQHKPNPLPDPSQGRSMLRPSYVSLRTLQAFVVLGLVLLLFRFGGIEKCCEIPFDIFWKPVQTMSDFDVSSLFNVSSAKSGLKIVHDLNRKISTGTRTEETITQIFHDLLWKLISGGQWCRIGINNQW